MYNLNSSNSMAIQDAFHGISAESFNVPKVLGQHVSLESFLRPSLYYSPLLHWVPGHYSFDDFKSGGISAIGKHRRNRTAFSQQQLAVLERAFLDTQYPDLETRDQLSRSTGLPETKIQVWFKNRRAKHRKLQKSKEKNGASPLMKSKEDISSTSSFLAAQQATKNIHVSAEPDVERIEGESDISVGQEDVCPSISYAGTSFGENLMMTALQSTENARESKGATRTDKVGVMASKGPINQTSKKCSSSTTGKSSHVTSCFYRSSANISSSFSIGSNAQSIPQCVPVMYSHPASAWPLICYGNNSTHFGAQCSSSSRFQSLFARPFATYFDGTSESETEYDCLYTPRN